MKFHRHVIEVEGAEVVGYDRIKYNLGESSVGERPLSSIGMTLGDMDFPYYQDHYGLTELRKRVAEIAGNGSTYEQVIITDGATMALFMSALVLLNKGDHVVIMRPNYSVNGMMPVFMEANVEFFNCDFDKAALEQTLEDEPKLKGIVCDVADEAQVATLFEKAIAHLGGLDVLVSMAGIAGPTASTEEISLEDWRRCLAVNLDAHLPAEADNKLGDSTQILDLGKLFAGNTVL